MNPGREAGIRNAGRKTHRPDSGRAFEEGILRCEAGENQRGSPGKQQQEIHGHETKQMSQWFALDDGPGVLEGHLSLRGQ